MLSESFKKRLTELAGIPSSSIKREEVYFDTLSAALDGVRAKVSANNYQIANADNHFFHFSIGGVSYGETKKGSFDLVQNGKETKKKIHVQIYRMDSGRYELNCYIA